MPGLKQFDEDDYMARGGEAGWHADRDLEREYKDRRAEKQDAFDEQPDRRWHVVCGPYRSTVTAYDVDEAKEEFREVLARTGVSPDDIRGLPIEPQLLDDAA